MSLSLAEALAPSKSVDMAMFGELWFFIPYDSVYKGQTLFMVSAKNLRENQPDIYRTFPITIFKPLNGIQVGNPGFEYSMSQLII